ncbi:RlpA-like double-psi beta-barrel-protein domain-containing protein-containing protein [Butyriboletus roseoflavus]|nr:RlpA-like double-psi beta-barrel-protein domain-containing protein-containing protein [Butyriboletus roseoflavus]
MHQFTIIFTVLSIFCLSVLAAPLPSDQALGERGERYGRGTWFYDGWGACGFYNANSDLIVAISAQIYGTGANCGQWVRVTNTQNGNTAFGMMRDECQSCGPQDLDMSIAMFEAAW